MKERIEKIMSILGDGEAALVLSEANRFYLTGFASSAGALVISRRRACFFIDFRYVESARAHITHTAVVLMERFSEQLAAFLREERASLLLVETDSMSLSTRAGYAKSLLGVKVPPDDRRLDDALLAARAVKSPHELACIKEAQRLTDETFSYILGRMTVGRTEREVMLDMEFFMRRAGSEGVSFDFIVVSGKNSSLPHGVPTDKPLAHGDFVTMDFGAVVGGYRSDMTRTVALGAVSEDQRRVYDTVLAAQEAAFAVMRAGVRGCDVDRAARDLIDRAGYAGCFGHSLGHSVGIEIHESPTCAPRATAPLPAGTVMTVEPGIYLEDRFGVRIEDMVFLTDDGYENLTGSEKALLIL